MGVSFPYNVSINQMIRAGIMAYNNPLDGYRSWNVEEPGVGYSDGIIRGADMELTPLDYAYKSLYGGGA
jgi:hypothetical protein